jgi:long-chain fatty acid transport protein
VTVVGGGGKVDFSQGNWTTRGAQLFLVGSLFPPGTAAPGPAKLTAESVYLGYTLGGAYEVNEMFSFSVGLRYVDASREAKASGSILTGVPLTFAIDFEEEGDGWGGIFGFNIAPNEKFNIGLRFETKTNIDLEATVKENTLPPGMLEQLLGISNGQSRPRDLPGLVALGVSYWINPKLRIETNYTQYLNTNADWGGDEDLVSDGYDVGITLEYHFNDAWLASVGYLHTVLGMEPGDMLPENPELDTNTIGAGIAYAFNEKFHTNVSIGNSFYKEDSFVQALDDTGTNFANVEYEKNVFFMALGLEYRF